MFQMTPSTSCCLRGGVWTACLILLLFLHACVTVGSSGVLGASTIGTFYQLESRSGVGLINITHTWSGTTLVECAVMAASLDTDCKSFLWDPSDGTCKHSNRFAVSDGTHTPSGSQAMISQSHGCRFDLGYELRIFGAETRCVFVSPPSAVDVYANQCDQTGGRLFKANSLDSFDLLYHLAAETHSSSTWILVGLGDKVDEGVFVWSDGEEMTGPEKELLFTEGEPNDRAHSENCVVLQSTRDPWTLLIDIPCSWQTSYACEMDF